MLGGSQHKKTLSHSTSSDFSPKGPGLTSVLSVSSFVYGDAVLGRIGLLCFIHYWAYSGDSDVGPLTVLGQNAYTALSDSVLQSWVANPITSHYSLSRSRFMSGKPEKKNLRSAFVRGMSPYRSGAAQRFRSLVLGYAAERPRSVVDAVRVVILYTEYTAMYGVSAAGRQADRQTVRHRVLLSYSPRTSTLNRTKRAGS